MRETVFILPKDFIPIAFAATNKMVKIVSEKFSKYMGISKEEYEETSREIMSLLHGKGMTAAGIKKTLCKRQSVSPIVNLMCDKGLLIRGPPNKGWKSNTYVFSVQGLFSRLGFRFN